MSKKVYDVIKNKEGLLKMQAKFNVDLSGRDQFYFYAEDRTLHDEENQVPLISEEFLSFVRNAPMVHVTKIGHIQADQFETIKKEMAKQMEALERDNKLLKSKIAEQEKNFEQMYKEREELSRRLVTAEKEEEKMNSLAKKQAVDVENWIQIEENLRIHQQHFKEL